MKIAYFGAGCFWHVQKEFDGIGGVIKTEVGYIGNKELTKKYRKIDYKLVSSGVGFVESVKVVFNEDNIDYEKLLNLFWNIHDPTSLNRQGNDVGVQYKSVIFFTSPDQETKARASLLEARIKLKKEIATEIKDFRDYEFIRAEEDHQHYLG